MRFPRGSFARSLPGVVVSLIALALAIWWAAEVSPPIPGHALLGVHVLESVPTGLSVGQLVALIVGFTCGSVLSILPHELGHLIAAWSLRLPVLGVAIGRMIFGQTTRRAGQAAHVSVDLRRASPASLPVSMVIFALGGPVGGLVFAMLVAIVAADSELPLIVRLPLGGVVAGSIAVQLANLVPGATRAGALTDGALALQWAFRPASQLERVRLARDVETYRTDRGKVAGDPGLSDEEFEQLRGTLGDPRNQIASVAIGRMLIWLVASVRAFEGETDPALSDFARRARATAPEVGNFAARAEPPLNLRSSAAVTMAYVLIWLYLKELAGSPADPTSPQMVQLVALAEQAWRLQPEKQVTRNALGLARLLQNRPADTRALLMNMADNGEAIDEEVRSDADAIRGLAECELGDLAQAQRLLASARRRTVQSDYVDWLDTAIRRRSGQAEIRPH